MRATDTYKKKLGCKNMVGIPQMTPLPCVHICMAVDVQINIWKYRNTFMLNRVGFLLYCLSHCYAGNYV